MQFVSLLLDYVIRHAAAKLVKSLDRMSIISPWTMHELDRSLGCVSPSRRTRAYPRRTIPRHSGAEV